MESSYRVTVTEERKVSGQETGTRNIRIFRGVHSDLNNGYNERDISQFRRKS